MKNRSSINTVNEIISNGISKGILHLYTEDESYSNNSFRVEGKDVVNFGSCSYLGLEFDERLKNAGIAAINNFGTQFSASRSYVSCGLYADLEKKFDAIFDGHTVMAPTTTIGHIATIPTLVDNADVVIMDHQVHASVQNAVQLLKPRGIKVEVLRHNRMDLLEDRIKFLRTKYKKIWYMADGIYSMFGDKAPLDDIFVLLDKYPEFHFYADDAHGMSCYGDKGQGYVLSKYRIHDKMVVATSLAKGFATGGSVFVFPNKELAQLVRNVGGPMITSGPMQPAALGAAIASADIHLSDEINSMRNELHENIKYTNLLFKKLGIPLASENDTPIFFIAVGLPKMGYNLVNRAKSEGFYTNLGIFPAVPIKNTGVRFTITRQHTFEQIERFAEMIAFHYPLALEEEKYSLDEVRKVFGLKTEDHKLVEAVSCSEKYDNLSLEHFRSIGDVSRKEWDNIFAGKGSFDWDGLNGIEKSFQGNELPEDNWSFDYIVVRDINTKKVVLATFTTTSISKDDMMSDSQISDQIEEVRRKENPYYLTSKVTTLGSFLTIGDHLYLDESSDFSKQSVELLLQTISGIKNRENSSNIMLRDFMTENKDLEKIITDNGYFKNPMPDNHVVYNPSTGDKLLETASKKSRIHLRKQVFKKENLFEVKIASGATDSQIEHWYRLYMNVKNNKSEINTFILPKKLFKQIAISEQWEVIELYIKNENQSKPVSVIFNYKSGTSYSLMMIGLDYEFSKFNIYQQTLYASMKRAEELSSKEVILGVTASFEKKKFGAEVVPMHSYVQLKDHYNMSVIQTLEGQKELMV